MKKLLIIKMTLVSMFFCGLCSLPAAEVLVPPDKAVDAADAADELRYRIMTSGKVTRAYVRARLKRGVDPNTVILHDGQTLLGYAAGRADVLMVEMLLAHGADVDLVDSGGNTALLSALLSWQGPERPEPDQIDDMCDIIDLLCAQGAQVDVCNDFGATPLSLSVDYPEVLSYLIKKNANLDMQGSLGRTALSDAAAAHQLASVKLLLEAGANPLLKDTNENTPWHHALEIMREKHWIFNDPEKKKNALAVIELLDQAGKTYFQRHEQQKATALQKLSELKIS